MKSVVVFFADGFEECEGLLVVDLCCAVCAGGTGASGREAGHVPS